MTKTEKASGYGTFVDTMAKEQGKSPEQLVADLENDPTAMIEFVRAAVSRVSIIVDEQEGMLKKILCPLEEFKEFGSEQQITESGLFRHDIRAFQGKKLAEVSRLGRLGLLIPLRAVTRRLFWDYTFGVRAQTTPDQQQSFQILKRDSPYDCDVNTEYNRNTPFYPGALRTLWSAISETKKQG